MTRDQVKRDHVERVDFYLYFADYCRRLLDRQKTLWRQYYNIWLRSALYYDGKQILVPRSNGFGFDIKRLTGIDHPLFVYNKLRPYSDEVTSMWVQSSPEILFAALDEDDRRAEKALSEIELLNDYWNHLHFTEEVRQDVAKGAQFCGNYHFEVYFDPNAENGFEWIEEFAPLQMPESLWYECLDCGQAGEMPENGACPHCGGMATPFVMPAVNVPDAIPTRAEWQQAGEVVVKPGPAWSQRYSLTTGASNSPWRYVEEDQPRERIEFTYGKLDPSASQEVWGTEDDMHPERIMRRAERQRGGYEAEDDTDNVLSQRFWLEPEMLHYCAARENVTLPSGDVIPAGERLSDVFADSGMLILTAPGLPRFLNVTHESHLRRWVDGKYGITPGVKVGHGNEDGVEHQRQRNVLKSGRFRYYQKTLQPSIAVNGRVFKDSRLFNRVDNVISIANSALPEGTKVSDHFAHVAPPAINPQIFLEEEQQDADMQAALKAYNSGGDFAGIEDQTATATRVGASREARSHNVHLALSAGTQKEVAIRRIALAQEHYSSLRIVATMDKLSGERKRHIISAVNIRCQFIAWIKTGSFMPNLDLEKQAQFTEAVNASVALFGVGLLNPASLQSINKRFNTDLTFEALNERVEECEETLDLMLAAFAQMQGMITPEELYMLNPVDVAATGHQAALLWWRDWLASKEGRTSPEIIKQAVRIHVGQRFIALQTEQAYMAALANTGAVVAGVQAAGVAGLMPEEGNGKPGGGKSKTPATDNPMVGNPMTSDPMAAIQPSSMGGM